MLILALALAGCGQTDDPCAVATGGVQLYPASLQQLGVTESRFDTCAGKADGVTVSCAGAALVTRSSCNDGFAWTVDSGNVKLLVHFRQGNPWTAGAKLSGGKTLASDSSSSIAGLGASAQPPRGTTQAAKFDLVIDRATLSGEVTTTW